MAFLSEETAEMASSESRSSQFLLLKTRSNKIALEAERKRASYCAYRIQQNLPSCSSTKISFWKLNAYSILRCKYSCMFRLFLLLIN